MRNSIIQLANKLVDIKVCNIITICMFACGILAGILGEDSVFSLIVVRVIFCLINFLIASILMTTGKKPIFLLCVYMGILCFFLYQVWNLCNYLWIGSDSGTYMVSGLSNAGFYLFLFTASYGALDSLVDDGTKSFRKYRRKGALGSIVVTFFWIITIDRDNGFGTVIVGITLTILSYIIIKHIVIPDVENGFVVTLRKYYIIIRIMIIIRVIEILLTAIEAPDHLISLLRFLGAALSIWVFPLAYRGAKKWISM